MTARKDWSEASRSAVVKALALAVACVMACVWLVAIAGTASAASRPLSWTVPTNAVTRSVEVIVRDPSGVEWARTPFADSAMTRPHAPKAAGRDTCWINDTPGTIVHWVRLCNGAGCSDWSNRMVGAVAVPDTLFLLTRGRGALAMPGYPWQRSRFGRVGWSLVPGDSAAARVVHQEDAQRAYSGPLVKSYGYWMLRGAPVFVEDHDPPRIEP